MCSAARPPGGSSSTSESGMLYCLDISHCPIEVVMLCKAVKDLLPCEIFVLFKLMAASCEIVNLNVFYMPCCFHQ